MLCLKQCFPSPVFKSVEADSEVTLKVAAEEQSGGSGTG